MAELFLELLSEEIPARMQARAAQDLKRLACDGLKEAELGFDKAEAYSTPRRLALVVSGLPTAQPDVKQTRKGPNVNAPEKALQGFRASVPEGAAIEKREMPKGAFLFAVIERKGRPAAEVLPNILGKALAGISWPKSQRWGDHAIRWVRPLHSIVCLFDGKVVPVSYGPINAGNVTLGHRFLASGDITVTSFAQYEESLFKAKVLLSRSKRREKIKADTVALAESAGLALDVDEALLDEVTGLVEWPVALIGDIDEAFMGVPAEVLITSMKSHQKYFSVRDKDGALAPKFVAVSNTEAPDGDKSIVVGNERVLRARLSDAKFFWDQDRKKTLESRLPQLSNMVFHAKLGTVKEKVERVEALACALAPWVDADPGKAARAACLAKADLLSGMVCEFPEAQGVMGRYYALCDGEDTVVADAIAEHYSPLGPSDVCPSAPVSVAVALADKIDTLAGFWILNEKPTGSKDPFALRRAALGVIRLIVENGLRLPLSEAFKASYKTYAQIEGADEAAVSSGLLGFFADRLKAHLKEKGVRHDLIGAVFAVGGQDDLVRLLARVEALKALLDTDDGANLLTAYGRAANILRIEEKKDGVSYDAKPDESLLQQDEEKALSAALAEAIKSCSVALEKEDFTTAMAALARLRQPVDAFFGHVTVNCKDKEIRANRLKILSEIRSAPSGVADFSKVEGG